MSEQDEASVGRYLDRRDDAQRDQAAEADEGRRARATGQRWEHMTWLIHAAGHEGASVDSIDGRKVGEPPRMFYETLANAGAEGWEVVASHSPSSSIVVLFLKRPKAEG
jgi:hypothetical protein